MNTVLDVAKALLDRLATAKVPVINLEISVIKDILWEKIREPAAQRKLILVIVSTALLLDNMLYMVIVPIIPDYLRLKNLYGDGPINYTRPAKPIPRAHHGEDSATGILFASKAIVQLMINPFSGALIDRIGYDIPMMIGLCIMFLSTAVFACGSSYGVLFFARSLQGVGSAFADTSGLAMIADRFTEENERSKALGIALAFISFGCLVAPPFGGALYQFAGKEIPFLILAFVSLLDGFMLLLVMKPMKQQMEDHKHLEKVPTTPIWRLFMDPYIAVCSGALMMSNVALAFLEPTISLWMEDNITPDSWKIGMIWLPAFFPHVFGVILTVKMSRQYPNYQWLMVAIGLALEGLCCFVIPFSTSYQMLMLPICGICFGIALVDTAILPTLGYIVDVRYVSVYGSIYAIADISYSLAYAVGPVIAGEIVEAIGFTSLNIMIAFSNLIYAPVLYRLRNIYDFKPFQNEANILMSNPPDKEYQTYMMQEREPNLNFATDRESTGNATAAAGWRQSVTNWSKWFFSTGQVDAEIGGGNTFESSLNETKLPKLPVPDIEHTLCRYLEALQPILSESHYQRVTSIIARFGADDGIGPKLQEILHKRRELYDNWAYDWWLDDMYLNNPIALPINSNPGMVWPPRNFSTTNDMIRFATRMISAALQYKKRLDRRELPTETVTSKGVTQPMCMAQYYRIFATYRAPGIPKDSQFRSETEYTKARPHIIVACRGYFYVLHLTKGMNSEVLTETEIASQLLGILNDNKGASQARFAVGAMTGLSRDTWATIRERLMKDENNQRNLSAIEKCMLIVCLDLEEMPSNFNSKINKVEINEHRTPSRDETSMAHQMIHGGGSRVHSGNRWFDKTIQFIIGSDGVNGLCYEHSPAEGVAVINATETILAACTNLEEIVVEADSSIVPEKLNWNLNPTLEKDILSGMEQFDRNVTDLDFNVFRFNGYGKNFIKSCQCSPDGYIQLALQLAYFKIYRHLCATYESASTRRFLLGRVDCIRAETPEALKWVSAMQADLPQAHSDTQRTRPQIPREKKLELFQAALRKQVEITTENITGVGIDIHLLGWRQAARDHLISTELFEDESYTIANHFSLSTSQVATKINSFMGYGAVVPDGYGASYNPKEDSIVFCISSFHSNEVTNTKAYTESLRESLNSMRDLLAYKQQM